MLTRAVLASPNYAIGAELAAAILIGIIIIGLAPVLGSAALLAFGALVIALMVGASWYFFTQQQLLIDFTYPLLSSLIVYLTLVFGNYFTEQAQKKQIRSAFGQYLSPALVEQLAKSPEKLVLGGEQRDMTIMFSDVRGFTSISELYKNDPQGLTTLMNRLLTPLTNAIINRKGTIDKYMGDAIMAFWNAPIDDAQHEVNACAAALDMLDRIEVLNRERESEAHSNGTPFIPLKVGVGINTGTLRGRQYGVRSAVRLFGARRQRQSGVAHRGPVEDIRSADHRRLAHRCRVARQVCHARNRLSRGEGKERAGNGVCHYGPG